MRSYRDRGVRVFFSRVPAEASPVYMRFVRSGIRDLVGPSHFVDDVGEALRLTEIEASGDEASYVNLAGDDGGG